MLVGSYTDWFASADGKLPVPPLPSLFPLGNHKALFSVLSLSLFVCAVFWIPHVSGKAESVCFVCLTALGIMISRSIRVAASGIASFPF